MRPSRPTNWLCIPLKLLLLRGRAQGYAMSGAGAVRAAGTAVHPAVPKLALSGVTLVKARASRGWVWQADARLGLVLQSGRAQSGPGIPEGGFPGALSTVQHLTRRGCSHRLLLWLSKLHEVPSVIELVS